MKRRVEEKEGQIIARLSAWMRYLSLEDQLPALLEHWDTFPFSFKEPRSITHLERVVMTTFFHQRDEMNAAKLLKTQLALPEGKKSVLGVIFTHDAYACFEVLDLLIHGIEIVEGSHIDIYFEIERKKEPEFSLEEVNLIKHHFTLNPHFSHIL